MFRKISKNLLVLIAAQLLQMSAAQRFIPDLPVPVSEVPAILLLNGEQSRLQEEQPVVIPEVPPVSVTPRRADPASLFPRQEVQLPALENNPPVLEGPGDNNAFKTLRDHLIEMQNDPLRALGAIAENVSSRFRQRLGTTSTQGTNATPFNFLSYLENLQRLMDEGNADDQSCSSIFATIDHTIYTTQQILNSLQALSKLRNAWAVTNMEGIASCFTKRGLLQPQDIVLKTAHAT